MKQKIKKTKKMKQKIKKTKKIKKIKKEKKMKQKIKKTKKLIEYEIENKENKEIKYPYQRRLEILDRELLMGIRPLIIMAMQKHISILIVTLIN